MRPIMVCLAALSLQGCLPLGGLFWIVAGNGMANRPEEVCESCKIEAATAQHLADDAVPKWMEESRLRAGPSATAERTGYFSWDISLDGRPISHCAARDRVRWHCAPLGGTPDLAPL